MRFICHKKSFEFLVLSAHSTGCFLRPVGLSLPYLIFLLYLPFVPVASQRSIRGKVKTDNLRLFKIFYDNRYRVHTTGHTGYYLKLLIFVSFCLSAVQIAFQVLLAVLGNDLITKCEFLEILLRHVGVVRLDSLEWAWKIIQKNFFFYNHLNSELRLFQCLVDNSMACSWSDIISWIHSCVHCTQKSLVSAYQQRDTWRWTSTATTCRTRKRVKSREMETFAWSRKSGFAHCSMCDWSTSAFSTQFRLLCCIFGRSYMVGL